MKICVIGTGYVGLVAGACLADLGNEVICVDILKEKIDKLNNGIIPIYEPGLEQLVKYNIERKRLTFSTDLKLGIQKSKVIFIAVGTPSKSDGQPDLSSVENVAAQIGENINAYKVIVNKSTVPVGTGKRVKEIIKKNLKNKKIDFDVVSNPEFLKEGAAIQDFMRPNRVVIGYENVRALRIMKDIYDSLFLSTGTYFVAANLETAEMIKYASNAFLATKISFINEMSRLCERVNADVKMVARGMGLDDRIGSKFLHAGPGYGGSCFPKDVSGLDFISEKVGYDFKIIKAVMNVNDNQKLWMVEKIEQKMKNIKGKTIGILGLSFKPNTDDIRESPALVIIDKLLKKGAKIKAFDPIAMEAAKNIFPSQIQFCTNSYEAAEGSSAIVFLTEWNEFREIDFIKLRKLLSEPIVFDLRNIFDPDKIKKLGFEYIGVGRIV
ncbi:UDP-glucose/GDP-mannose dehydrogenase family protein [Candidatus Poribacteria bacterium]|nr:UDP-glucose/GDP-mannose dehydrogenase family protein [Candidatus Poribacteria bacterium]